MTPAVRAAETARIRFTLHEYAHDPAERAYGEEAARALELDPRRVFKTLLIALNGDERRLAVGLVPVSAQLDLKAVANALDVKKALMADGRTAERATGYVLGGISPLGQRRRLPMLLDASAAVFETIFVSGGRRGLEIELAPADLLTLCRGRSAAIAKPV